MGENFKPYKDVQLQEGNFKGRARPIRITTFRISGVLLYILNVNTTAMILM